MLTQTSPQILYGDATEHRDIPMDDGIRLIYNDYVNKTKGVSQYKSYQHPDAIQTLLKTLAENRSLTVLQYDHLIKYLTGRREIQVKAEIGEDITETSHDSNSVQTPVTSFVQQQPQQQPVDPMSEMQKKILDALNKKPLTEMISKKNSEKSTISKDTREELKASLLGDASIKSAMAALFKRK